MIIRSQDKKSINAFNKISTVQITSTSFGTNEYAVTAFFSVEGDISELGRYSTEEKAIKVLDMIQERYINIELQGYQIDYERGSSVFQMPQDNEVKV